MRYLFLICNLGIFAPAKQKIGLVSGVGPLAGSDVLAKVFAEAAELYNAVEDSEYPDVVLVNHGIEGVDNSGALSKSFQQEIANMIHELETHGANIIGIACNTAHLYLHTFKLKNDTRLINLIDEVSTVASRSEGPYLLLTSLASKQQELYHTYLKNHSVIFTETTRAQQKCLDDAIGLVMAHKLVEAGLIMDRVLKSAKKAKFKAVIAGCTELPIAINNAPDTYGLEVIDSNIELARALLRPYYAGLKANT